MSIAYPFGLFNKKILKLTQFEGYEFGTGNKKLKETGSEKLQTLRFNVYLLDTLKNLKNKLDGKVSEARKLRLINFFANGTVLVNSQILNRRFYAFKSGRT
ncbi:hypothetical protein IT568_10855 [bacterium]|nr:hypothetical protein [bacterium]